MVEKKATVTSDVRNQRRNKTKLRKHTLFNKNNFIINVQNFFRFVQYINSNGE